MSGKVNILDGTKKIHFIGVGGIGMSGIAEYLLRKNHQVSGSDLLGSAVTRRLRGLGIKIFIGHDESNLSEDIGLVIYSSAVKDDNPELQKAKRLDITLIKRAEALGNIVNKKFVIAVSGTHGKTTTTALIAKILMENRNDPTVFIGGNVDFLEGGSSRIGKSNFAVVEADEYDRSFLELHPDIIIITNMDPDHLDIYKDIEDIQNNFKKFIEMGKPDLKVIACGDDINVVETLKDTKKVLLYGFGKNNGHIIEDLGYGKKTVGFSIDGDEMRLSILGKHNMLNAGAAYLAAREVGVSDEIIYESLKNFNGVKRRLELKFDSGMKIYDDYAHHPAEVKASLNAIKRVGSGRIITVFQPHLYSRTNDFFKEFGEAFSGTDILILAKIYPAREEEIPGVSSQLILDEFIDCTKAGSGKDMTSGKQGFYFEDKTEILDELEKIMKDGDMIIFQGAGDITELCDKFVKRIKTKLNWSVPL